MVLVWRIADDSPNLSNFPLYGITLLRIIGYKFGNNNAGIIGHLQA